MMEPERLATHHYLVAISLLALGALVVLEINDSAYLPGAHADSVEYMEAGRSLALGNGLEIPIASWASPDSVAPLAHFPPGSSLAIGAVIGATGVRPHVAALWVIALAAGATLGLSFLLVAAASGWAAGLLTALVIALMPPFPLVHTSVWSEPLYVPLMLLTLVFMMRWPERPFWAGLVASLTVMVRYLGLATVAAVGVWALVRTRSLKKALAGMAPGLLAFLAWWGWARSQGGAVRTPGEFDVAITSTLAQLPEMLRFWLAPGLPLFVALILLLGVAGTHALGRKSLVYPLGVLLGAHLVVVLAARLLVDQRIPFDTRVLLPALVLAMLPVATGALRRPGVGLVVLLAWVGWVGREDLNGIRSLHQMGQYYSSAEWLTSDLVGWVDNRSRGLRLYSNEPGLMVYQSERHARLLPLKTQDFDAFVEAWGERPGAIIVVAPLRQDEWSPDIYVERLPVQLILDSQNAVVLVPKEEETGGGEGP
jgi:hypothetical protein